MPASAGTSGNDSDSAQSSQLDADSVPEDTRDSGGLSDDLEVAALDEEVNKLLQKMQGDTEAGVPPACSDCRVVTVHGTKGIAHSVEDRCCVQADMQRMERDREQQTRISTY